MKHLPFLLVTFLSAALSVAVWKFTDESEWESLARQDYLTRQEAQPERVETTVTNLRPQDLTPEILEAMFAAKTPSQEASDAEEQIAFAKLVRKHIWVIPVTLFAAFMVFREARAKLADRASAPKNKENS